MTAIIYRVKQYRRRRLARVSQQEKDRSRERIVRSAARLFRERGIEGASVGDVMKDAGMTHGGFYRHFATKDALLDAGLESAFAELVAMLETGLAEDQPARVAEHFRQFYLSEEHVANAGKGCPATALSGEVGRAAAPTKGAFGAGVRAVLSALAQTRDGDRASRDDAAARELAMMVGAVAIARACDPGTAETVLAACRRSP